MASGKGKGNQLEASVSSMWISCGNVAVKIISSYQDQRGTSSELLWGMDSEEITLMDDGEVQAHLWKASTENRRKKQ